MIPVFCVIQIDSLYKKSREIGNIPLFDRKLYFWTIVWVLTKWASCVRVRVEHNQFNVCEEMIA